MTEKKYSHICKRTVIIVRLKQQNNEIQVFSTVSDFLHHYPEIHEKLFKKLKNPGIGISYQINAHGAYEDDKFKITRENILRK